MSLSNTLEIMFYGWICNGRIARKKLSRGLCLAFDPDKRLLTMSRLSAVDEFGLPVAPPSHTERLAVKSALEAALDVRYSFGDGYRVVSSELLRADGSSGRDWYMYRLVWAERDGEEE